MRVRVWPWPVFAVLALAFACRSDPPVGPSGARSARPTPRAAAVIVPTPTAPAGSATATPRPTSTAGATATPTATATARSTPAPTGTPAPAPTATPLPDGPPRAGPVAFVTFRLFTVRDGDTFRDPPFTDANGREVVNFGEILVFDVTPRNAANQPCEAQGEPEYTIENNDGANEKYLKQLSSSNPFLLRMQVVGRTGSAQPVRLYAKVDGKTSNSLFVVAK